VDITSISKIHKTKDSKHKPSSMEAFLDSYSKKGTIFKRSFAANAVERNFANSSEKYKEIRK
jgi:hypothetical protein